MDAQTLRELFKWCTIINGALYVLTAIMCMFARDWVYRLQSRWFPVSRDAFHVVLYSFLGLFKLLFLMFNVVPFIALLIVT